MKYKRKTKQNRKKTKSVLPMPKSIEYAHRKYEKVNTHKR